MKRLSANKASRAATLQRIASRKAARKLESRRKQRAHQLEIYANPNAGARAIYSQPRMNGNFRPVSPTMQFHLRAMKKRPPIISAAKAPAELGAPLERHK